MVKYGFVLAALSSGSGKTTIANGLLRLLSNSGMKCAPFKVGPDYIDPHFHKISCGKDSINLDLFMSGKEHVKQLFDKYSSESDIAIVEGVMGLFDGYDLKKGSAAEIAFLLDLPVIVVIDAKSSAFSLAAVISGLKNYDPDISVKGVIFNNVGSDNHASLLIKAAKEGGVKCLGCIRRRKNLITPSKYLGLDLEHPDLIENYVVAAAAAVEEDTDLQELLSIVKLNEDREGLDTEIREYRIPESFWTGKKIAVAKDEAFNFIYYENIRALRDLVGPYGKVVMFSPLHDKELPAADLVYFPGGYPEIYSNELSANRSMIESVRSFAEGGGKIYGECGGLLYLSRSIDGIEVCDVFPFRANMKDARLTLGYRKVNIGKLEIRGHEFHYSVLENPYDLPSISVQRGVRNTEVATGLYRVKNVVGGYTHIYWGERDRVDSFFKELYVS